MTKDTSMPHQQPYPTIQSDIHFPTLEQEVLNFWRDQRVFEASVEQREPKQVDGSSNAYVFYDGPPFANGLPHHGHLLTGFVKDAVARYQTMKGKRVERRFGWDCHGLPAEMEAEKQLGVSGRQQIMRYGIDKFNEHCRTSVMCYRDEWEHYVNRQARWVDFKNDYKTMDMPYMESVLWAFSELYKKGLIYEGFKVMPYSWAAETVLSSSEIRLDDATREKVDKAVTVAFKLKEKPEGAPEADEYYLLAWTTTPWTLPSNLALAVSGEMEYLSFTCSPLEGEPQSEQAMREEKTTSVVVTKCYILAKNTISPEFLRELSKDFNIHVAWKNIDGSVITVKEGKFLAYNSKDDLKHKEAVVNDFHFKSFKFTEEELSSDLLCGQRLREIVLKGQSLIGLQYEPLFPYFSNHPNAFRVLDGSSFIEEGSGTGVVHMAPGFGEDDMRVCAENGIDVIVPVDGEGRYTDAIFDLKYDPQSNTVMPAQAGIQSTRHMDSRLRGNDEELVIETKRCVLRVPTLQDEVHFIGLQTNERAMAMMNGGLRTEAEARAEHQENMQDFRKHGYGQWFIFHKESGQFMGRAGVSLIQQSGDMPARPTLRCCLLPEFWGGGYGLECSQAVIDFAFRDLGVQEIAGGAHPDNPAAYRMMKTLGMHHIADVQFIQAKGPYFLITKQEWQANVMSAQAGIQEDSLLDLANAAVRVRLRKNDIHMQFLSLKGLNVIQETQHKTEEEPYSEVQLQKYGLANLRIISWLKATGQLVKQEDYTHNYPHCWRTDKPIIYRAMSSWFVDVPKIRDRMVELNQQINWIPSHIKDGRFGKWLENAREWSISRSRFWGCPIPVWRSDNPASKQLYVFGSVAELEAFFDVKVEDLHKPFIDTLTKPDPENPNYTIRRVDEVFDCWFESGSMPYAQVHYPFENKEWFEANFPADFIVEYEAQTRGWFYNMMVLSVGLFDRIPFKNCICHGVVLDDKGRKLSKRLKNYMDPNELFDIYGSDALRWFMLSSTIMRGNELFLDPEGVFIRDAVRLYIKPLWNAYHFFCLYANADKVQAEFSITSDNIMDRYILAKLKNCVDAVENALDAYDTPAACAAITAFLEVLNNWYIRRNRARFWKDEQDADKKHAYNTLYTVLHTLCRIAAPFLPQVTEAIYHGLVNGGKFSRQASVHLADYPLELKTYQADAILMKAMDRVQDICNTAHAIRNEVNIRIRQPLASLAVYGAHITSDVEYFKSLIADETNVKEVVFSDDLESVANRRLKIHFPIVGKRLSAKMKAITNAAKAGEWSFNPDGTVAIEGETLIAGEFEFTLESTIKEGAGALSAQDGLVVLDTNLTDALIQEGIARDVVRLIQQSRKDAGLDVSDRIEITLEAGEDITAAVSAFASYICEQTLTLAIHDASSGMKGYQSFTHQLGNSSVILGLRVANERKAASA